MKILVIILSVFLVGQFPCSNSYAVTAAWPTYDPSLPEINMKVLIRNADGGLVAYFEPTLWYMADVNGIHALLNAKDQKILVHKNGVSYERIKFMNHFVIRDSQQITSEPLYYNGKQVLLPRHDGVILKEGYTIDVYWNILRLVN